MQDLKIALVQANQVWEDKSENLDNYSKLLEEVKDIDLILLPEMFHTGFSMNAENLAEKMNESQGINWLKKMAFEKNAAIFTSLIIRENAHYFNRGVFVWANGEIIVYDKRKRFGLGGEDKVYTQGSTETIVHYKGWNLQLQICYDLRFPEIVRNRIAPNHLPAYDVIVYVANWPQKRIEHWKTLLKARAIENQCYVAAVNRVGEDGNGLIYSGDSLMIDALGNGSSIGEGKEEVKIITLKMEELKSTREMLPFLKDR